MQSRICARSTLCHPSSAHLVQKSRKFQHLIFSCSAMMYFVVVCYQCIYNISICHMCICWHCPYHSADDDSITAQRITKLCAYLKRHIITRKHIMHNGYFEELHGCISMAYRKTPATQVINNGVTDVSHRYVCINISNRHSTWKWNNGRLVSILFIFVRVVDLFTFYFLYSGTISDILCWTTRGL